MGRNSRWELVGVGTEARKGVKDGGGKERQNWSFPRVSLGTAFHDLYHYSYQNQLAKVKS